MENAAGIIRIKIESGWRDWRTDMSEKYAVAANQIYRRLFDLYKGVRVEKVSKESELGQLDAKQGIDVVHYVGCPILALAWQSLRACK